MTGGDSENALSAIASVLLSPAPEPARLIANALDAKYPGSAIFLYGSGISVSANENPADILFDFYVIAPDYRSAIENPLERFAARAIPPNVYYVETKTEAGLLRAKYALLSLAALERLVSGKTFHSYFWARFAQPSRLVVAPEDLRARMIGAVAEAIETFLRQSQGLADNPRDWASVWLAGLNASYKAELRAEKSDRAKKLIDSYGAWPSMTAFALSPDARKSGLADIKWKMRAIFGAFLSVARLLKATATFRGGIDYIAWKVKRHAGVDVGVKPWERKFPFIAAPVVAIRYYKLRARARRAGQTGQK